MLSVDVNDLVGDNQKAFLSRLADPILLCDVLYVICKPQADSLGINDEQFGSSHDLEILEQASNIFWDAVIDFFPPRLREMLKMVIREARRVGEKSSELAAKAIKSGKIQTAVEDAANEAIRKMEAEFDSVFGMRSSDLPESVA